MRRTNSPVWTKPLKIIKEEVDFERDKDTNEDCGECLGNCCFFTQMMVCTTSGRYDFKINGLEGVYKDFQRVKENYAEMVDQYSHDTITWFNYWVGNSNWKRVFELDGKKIVGYACPMLNTAGKCSVYPSRPDVCRDAYRKKEERTPCCFKVVEEEKIL